MNGLEKLALFAPKLIRRSITSDPMAMAFRAAAKGFSKGTPASNAYKAYVGAMPKPVGKIKAILKTLAEGASAGGLMGLTAGTLGSNLISAAKAKKLKGGKVELPSRKEMMDAAMASIGEAAMSRF